MFTKTRKFPIRNVFLQIPNMFEFHQDQGVLSDKHRKRIVYHFTKCNSNYSQGILPHNIFFTHDLSYPKALIYRSIFLFCQQLGTYLTHTLNRLRA